MNKINLPLDRALSFLFTGQVLQKLEDGTTPPADINGWIINGTVIVDKNNSSLDVPIVGTITDLVNAFYTITISDADRDAIFVRYTEKRGLDFEVKAHFPDGTGATLADGVLDLIHSRDLSI